MQNMRNMSAINCCLGKVFFSYKNTLYKNIEADISEIESECVKKVPEAVIFSKYIFQFHVDDL